MSHNPYATVDLDGELRRGLCAGHRYVPASAWDDEVAGETDEERDDRHALARAVCDRCPVADRCLAEHERGIGGGMRAGHVYADVARGLPDRELNVAASGRRLRPACGEPGGRRAHVYRGEPVCDPCDEAHRTWNRDRVAVQRERAKASA